ncbi:hypothetical protein [Kamptonema sp. UHCC 0994]|uniref:hypothetical protein n=1 Tax=Kamptonema sp. UHCC 0994 TaxID=3031329 RepID=UPI0023BA1730|nr:hypothetical protein [Kamptonema sp. UHCC 0994]MDF0551569.1 hypothetical protein [Kamptonema sp. UHCC 0994]
MAAETIKLMVDYGCYPLWWETPDKAGDIDPETLSLKPETIKRLEKWAAVFDSILNQDYPPDSDFASPEEAEAFEEEGISLWHQLRQELAPDYEVHYMSEKLGKLLTDPRELEILVSQAS